ncbi:hypothetical protein L3Y34_006667 [Caenorhabditis briggsae]|uniref:Uncharacterized protein n=1 Tax=Caenorhabditis briggsae TaxID=6238 RepID=A0AAE9CY60_CAEBR|nr:hypothetical protein L3Y34_006667 [Caenorhabditis briggsae]
MIHVDKVDSLLTEKVKISASGLTPFLNYKFELRLHSSNGILRSYCILKSDDHGKIDLTSAKPIRGTYLEPDPMGLFMTVERTDDVSYGDMIKNFEGEPFFYSLRLLSESEELLDEVNLKKRWHHPLVAEIEVKQGRIWGVIYKPPGPGPFPCIIDTPVLSGRLCKTHAPLFASEGFLSFCFPMFDEPGLPKTLEDVNIEYLSKHIKYVQSLPYCSDKIGLYGISFAGTIAHHLATKHPELKAVATTNGPGAFYREKGYIRENGRPIECETLDSSLTVTENGVVKQKAIFSDLIGRLRPATSIKWKKISTNIPFRVLSSIDDWLVDGVTNGTYIRDNLLKTGHKVEIEFVNSGHVMVIPYIPHHYFGYNKFLNVNLAFGGDTCTHGKVQETAWEKHIHFFKNHLGATKKLPDYERETRISIPGIAGSKL